jgi:predicted  nucleic acid-binding Zn-ribbon protein
MMSIKKLELFLAISGGVVYWQTPGLKGHKGLLNSVDEPIQYGLDLRDNRGAFATFNHHINGEHYVSLTCGVLGKDDRGRPDAPYRFYAMLPGAIYQELGADAFALARWAFSKEVLGRRYGNTKTEEEGELFSPQVYQDFPPPIKADPQPDLSFLRRQLPDEQRLGQFLGALIAGVAPPLRFRDDGYAGQWSSYDPWSNRIPTTGERLLEELYLCLPYEVRSWCNISTAWKRCDSEKFPFHLALDAESSENAAAALARIVDGMEEVAQRKAQTVLKHYVTPLFQAIAKNDEKRINQLRRTFTLQSISWPSAPKTIARTGGAARSDLKQASTSASDPSRVALVKHPLVIGAVVVALIGGFGMGGWVFSSKGDSEETTAQLEKLQTEQEKLQTERNRFKTQLTELQGQFQPVKQERDELQKELNQATDKIDSLTGKVASLEKDKTSLKQELDTTKSEKTRDDNLNKAYGKTLTSLKTDLANCKTEKGKLTEQCQTEKSELAQDVAKKTQDYNLLVSDLDTCNTANGYLSQQLGQCGSEKDNLAQSVKNKTQEYDAKVAELDTCNTAKGGLESGLKTCQTEKGSLDSDLNACETGKGELAEQCQTDKSKLAEQCQTEKAKLTRQCEKEKDDLAQKLEQLEIELANLLPKTIAINEIAWMGTTKSASDEWIELHNYGDRDINLKGWKLIVTSGSKSQTNSLSGNIPKQGFLILRRKLSEKGPRVSLEHWKGATFDEILWNKGKEGKNNASLTLKDRNNEIVDQVDQWYAGENGQKDKRTMERKRPDVGGNVQENWCTASGYIYNSRDGNSPYDTGTPGSRNTCAE